MRVHPIGFKLLPAGFFVGNQALDNPVPGGDHCHHQLANPNLNTEAQE